MGTASSRSSPFLPVRLEPIPCTPRSALSSGWNRKSMRVLVWGLATTHTDPPGPPSPPLGPPRGTNFSRRNARHPRPPSPAATWMSTSSTNKLLDGLNADDAAVRAVVLEFHAAGDLREDRIVLADSRIEAGAEPAAP